MQRKVGPSFSSGEWIVSPDAAPIRLDKFLAGATRLGSRGRAVAALDRGKIFVNDEEIPRSGRARRLEAGDRVRAWIDRPGSSRRQGRRDVDAGGLSMIYEDETVLVVDKPPGLLTVPLDRRDAPSVQDQLKVYLRSRGKRRPLVVHRIDRDTSGLVVFATRPDVQQRLKDQFRRHEAERVYLTVVYGRPSPAEGTWRDRLAWDERSMVQKATHERDPRGADARCGYRVIEAFRSTSLLEITLVTGKRNQIRLQARLRGHTLVGEQRYVSGPDELRPISFGRQALHAHRLAFRHPLKERLMQFESPLPEDMAELVERLRRDARRPKGRADTPT